MRRVGLLGGGLLLALIGVAEGVDVDVGRYRNAALGSVGGRAYEERRKPAGTDQPLAGTTVGLFARSEAFLRRLGEIKRHARDSDSNYRLAATEFRKTREAYELALWEAGAADLARVTSVDVEGRFDFADVPAGAWLVLAWRSTFVDTPPSAVISRRDRKTFVLGRRERGYQVVSAWFREITVLPGARESVDLTDRNGWFTGIVEEVMPDAGR